MRITVLGGYAAPTTSGSGCSGYLVQHEQTSVVADLGPATLGELRRHVDVRSLDAILISHGHLDHVLDLAALHHLLMYSPTPLDRKVPLFLPPSSSGQFDLWEQALYGGSDDGMLAETFEVSEYDPSVELTVGDLSVRFRATVHPLQAWAMRFSNEGAESIGYTADTGPSADLDPLFSGVDVLVSETTYIDSDEPSAWRGHLTAAEAGMLAARAGASTLVLSHRWEEDDGAILRERASCTFTGRIELSRPGLTIDTASPTV